MIEILAKLLALREVDETIHKVEGMMADLAHEASRLRKRIEEIDLAWERRREEHNQLRHAANTKTLEVDETDERIRSYQKKLDEDIISYKEMEYLREQVAYLRKRLEELEEEALGLLDEVEADARKLVEDEEAYRKKRADIEAELNKVEAQRADLEKQRRSLLARREEALAQLPPHLREHYQRLHESVSDPVVPVEDGACGGCHLRLSETTLERVREGREVVVCENCSRFLYSRWR